jgi:hypothetical protein
MISLSTRDQVEYVTRDVCMTLPGGGLRLQTSGRLATQLFDSTLRTVVFPVGYRENRIREMCLLQCGNAVGT